MKIDLKKIDFGRLLKEYGLIHLGSIIYAFSWTAIVQSAGGIGGGASGLALLIQYATGLPMGIGYIIINAVLLAVALAIVGPAFGVKTVWGIASISLWLNVFQAVLPPDLLGLAGDKLLSSILAGVVSGIGVGLCLLQGGSTGGTDIVAMMINKYRRVTYGRVLAVSDFFIIGSAYFVYRGEDNGVNPLAMIIYGYVMVGVISYTVDMVLAGNKQSSQIFIFSKKYEEIARLINARMHRGVTILDGTGAYTGQPSKMLLVMCRKVENNNIMRIVKQIDPEALISISSVMGVYGRGFEAIEVRARKESRKKSLKEQHDEKTV